MEEKIFYKNNEYFLCAILNNISMETAKVEVQKEFPQEQELKEKMEKLNQLNAELNIKIDENEIIDDFDDEKENDKSKEKSDKNRNDDTRF